MACSKYSLTNTGATPVNFNYQRCDDLMWEYQVNLDPNETKTIWIINGSYSTAPLFQSSVSLINYGAFPLPPTPTPSNTPTNTPTPSVTPTPTVTPTTQPLYEYTNIGFDELSTSIACSVSSTRPFYGTKPSFNDLVVGDIIYNEIPAPLGSEYLSDGTNYIQTDNDGVIIVGLTPC
jgi:hypothetical protein